MSLRWWLSIMIALAGRLSAGSQAPTAATPVPTVTVPVNTGPVAPAAAPISSQQCYAGGATAVSVVSRQNASGHWLGDAWVERPAPPGRPLGALSLHLSHERRRCGDASTVVMHLKLEGPPSPVPPDYHLFGGLGYYKAHPERLSWLEAKKVCEDEGGHLVILNSQEEADIIKNLAASLGGVILVGVHDMFSDGKFVTVHGEPLETTGYANWKQNEPNGGKNENCVNIYASGLLNDLSCDKSKYAFVCEYPPL
ncbi:hypothetical protein R5R35_001026 [Gryllus longicercus]|uniref:C-type lectin domain-containing protein n=1 Tax=Gryllus longicercus TaxID=2509291 RepID=A0AAN9VTN9_9ORTH